MVLTVKYIKTVNNTQIFPLVTSYNIWTIYKKSENKMIFFFFLRKVNLQNIIT